jgi:hypothetical protein
MSGAGQVARARRKRRKSKALGFFLLAGLTLLIAGLIARHEIPFLIRHSHHRAHANVIGDNAASGSLVVDHKDRNTFDAPASGQPQEEITRSDREELGNLIRERSRQAPIQPAAD